MANKVNMNGLITNATQSLDQVIHRSGDDFARAYQAKKDEKARKIAEADKNLNNLIKERPDYGNVEFFQHTGEPHTRKRLIDYKDESYHPQPVEYGPFPGEGDRGDDDILKNEPIKGTVYAAYPKKQIEDHKIKERVLEDDDILNNPRPNGVIYAHGVAELPYTKPENPYGEDDILNQPRNEGIIYAEGAKMLPFRFSPQSYNIMEYIQNNRDYIANRIGNKISKNIQSRNANIRLNEERENIQFKKNMRELHEKYDNKE